MRLDIRNFIRMSRISKDGKYILDEFVDNAIRAIKASKEGSLEELRQFETLYCLDECSIKYPTEEEA